MSVMLFPFDNTPEAAEYKTTSECPMNCSYCYIPKCKEMGELQKKINENIVSGKFIEDLFSLYGEELKNLSLWGAEPMVSLDLITDKLENIFEKFPKLEGISFSTSFILDINIIERFIDKLDSLNRDIKFVMQISIDGPEWITDTNRQKGAVKKIKSNLDELIEFLNERSLKNINFIIKLKSTHDPWVMNEFLEDPQKFEDYIDFFVKIDDHVNDVLSCDNVEYKGLSYHPTLMVPGKYSVKDGRIFSKFLKECETHDLPTTYTFRLNRIINFDWNLHRTRQFTCSGGDSNFGIGEKVHVCHRTYFLNDDEYIKAIMRQESSIGDPDNWDVSLYKKGSIDNVRKNLIVDKDNKFEFMRFLHILRSYHDFKKLRVNNVITTVKALALAGQAEERFLHDENYCVLFGEFMNSCMDCSVENYLNTGSLFVMPISVIRLWSNGAFAELIKSVKRLRTK